MGFVKTKIVFRADGNSEIGLGHVIRSLALVQMLKEEFLCIFAIQKPTPNILAQINMVCSDVIQLPYSSSETDGFIYELEKHLNGSEVVVLDGYNFSTDYQRVIKAKGCKLVCIDDIHQYHFLADIVINHGLGFNANNYSGESYTRFFFGPSYILLRSEFLEAAKNRSSNFLCKEILICLGGADPKNDTLKVIRLIHEQKRFKGYKSNIVLGAGYSGWDSLIDYTSLNKVDANIVQSINAKEMVILMRRAEVAICAPSGVSLEFLSVGQGKLFLVYLADNQKMFYNYLIGKKIALDFFDDIEGIIDDNEVTKIKETLDGDSQTRYLEIFRYLNKTNAN